MAEPDKKKDDQSLAPASSPATANSNDNKSQDQSSKLKALLGILKNFIGVSDIANVRFSLPAQLMEPIPNLEYWNYLDRPEYLASIGKSDDDLGRMLEVLRFWFTKDLKYIKGKPCKPYNSALGEFFRCNWEVDDSQSPIFTDQEDTTSNAQRVKISYLTEQISHHPPVSAFYVDCPERGVSARGFDQIAAKFNPTSGSIRVAPGQHNHGIFINVRDRDNEEYQLTHPAAHLSGLLRASLYIFVTDTCYITCPKTRIKVLLQYLEDGWLRFKMQHRVVGVIFRYDPEKDDKIRIKDVPEKDVLARIEGSWQDTIYFILAGSHTKQPLMDVKPLFPEPKQVPPDEVQLSNESRRYWSEVTRAIHAKEYTHATSTKLQLENNQRELAAAREEQGMKYQPRFFKTALEPTGRPELSEEGVKVLEGLHKGEFTLAEREGSDSFKVQELQG